MGDMSLRHMDVEVDQPLRTERYVHTSVAVRKMRTRLVRAECTCGARADGSNTPNARFALTLQPCGGGQ